MIFSLLYYYINYLYIIYKKVISRVNKHIEVKYIYNINNFYTIFIIRFLVNFKKSYKNKKSYWQNKRKYGIMYLYLTSKSKTILSYIYWRTTHHGVLHVASHGRKIVWEGKNKKDKKVIYKTKENMLQLLHQMRKATRENHIDLMR